MDLPLIFLCDRLILCQSKTLIKYTLTYLSLKVWLKYIYIYNPVFIQRVFDTGVERAISVLNYALSTLLHLRLYPTSLFRRRQELMLL